MGLFDLVFWEGEKLLSYFFVVVMMWYDSNNGNIYK